MICVQEHKNAKDENRPTSILQIAMQYEKAKKKEIEYRQTIQYRSVSNSVVILA